MEELSSAIRSEAIVQLGGAMIIMAIVLLLGRTLRRGIKPLRALFLPTSVVAGVTGMLLGPQVFGALAARYLGDDAYLASGIVPEWALDTWSSLPKVLISVVFAGLLMGKTLPSLREVWRKSGPQVMLGYSFAFGQYAIGFLIVLALLTPVFGIDPMAGALLEIAMTGGHGTAAGLEATFIEVGFEEGRDLALALATIGVVAGVLIGTLFINVAVRSPRITIARQEIVEMTGEGGDISNLNANEGESGEADDAASDPLTRNLALIGVAIAIGWLLKQLLVGIESLTWGAWTDTRLMPLIPLFPLAMIGGVILQLILARIRMEHMVDRIMINRISGVSLDIIIVAAMATVSLEVLGDNLLPILILSGAALGWSVFCFWVLAPRMLPERWFERGIGDFGQSTGMAVTGLLLMRIADPRGRANAIEGFGYKQLLFEPLVGGGLITALSVPFTAMFGPVVMLVSTSVLTIGFISVGIVQARKMR